MFSVLKCLQHFAVAVCNICTYFFVLKCNRTCGFPFFCRQYIVFDTQLLLGGKHKYSISQEEYIFASLNLYVDIVQMFLLMLSLVSNAR